MSGFPRAFSIGLTPVAEPASWLAPDSDFGRHLSEKDRLIAAVPERVFMAEEDTGDAQREVADLLCDHLPSAFPATYRKQGDTMRVAGREVAMGAADRNVLQDAARLVSDDLVLMRKKAQGWTLVAASLCFQSYWNLAEKFGRPIAAIHEPVPGFGPGTRNAMLIDRIFDHLQVGQPVQRSNWSVHEDGELHHIEPHGVPVDCADADAMAKLFLRREHQTLTRLPESGDILFTIRVRTAGLSGSDDVAALAERLDELDAAGLQYKGLADGRDRLADFLRRPSRA